MGHLDHKEVMETKVHKDLLDPKEKGYSNKCTDIIERDYSYGNFSIFFREARDP